MVASAREIESHVAPTGPTGQLQTFSAPLDQLVAVGPIVAPLLVVAVAWVLNMRGKLAWEKQLQKIQRYRGILDTTAAWQGEGSVRDDALEAFRREWRRGWASGYAARASFRGLVKCWLSSNSTMNPGSGTSSHRLRASGCARNCRRHIRDIPPEPRPRLGERARSRFPRTLRGSFAIEIRGCAGTRRRCAREAARPGPCTRDTSPSATWSGCCVRR